MIAMGVFDGILGWTLWEKGGVYGLLHSFFHVSLIWNEWTKEVLLFTSLNWELSVKATNTQFLVKADRLFET